MVSRDFTASVKRDTARSIWAMRKGSGSSVLSLGSRNDAAVSRVTPRAARICANGPLMPESDRPRTASSSRARKRQGRPLNELMIPRANPAAPLLSLEGAICGSSSASIVMGMAHLDPTHGARRRTHHDGMSRHALAIEAHALEQRGDRDAGGREDHVAGREIAQHVFPFQIANAELFRAMAFVIVAEDQTRLELAADAAQRRSGEHAFGRPALPEIDIDTGRLGFGRGDDAGDVAIGDELDGGAGGSDALDDLLVPRPVEHQRSDALRLHALGLCKRENVVGGFGVEIDEAFLEARSDGDLVHVD